jgi:hypothetical protein
MTAYERALQRAREYRAESSDRQVGAADRRDSLPVENRPESSDRPVSASETRPAAESDLPEVEAAEGDDEVVAFQADRNTGLGRFSAPIEYIDDVSEEGLNDDFELDRSFRPEETETQSGQRWWQTFGRHRVFNQASGDRPQSERSTPRRDESRNEAFFDDEIDDEEPVAYAEVDHAAEAYDPDPNTDGYDPRPTFAGFDINWDDSTLAPATPGWVTQLVPSRSTHAWSSLDYLDDADDGETPLEPLAWVQPTETERAPVSRRARCRIRQARKGWISSATGCSALSASRPEGPPKRNRSGPIGR